MDETIIYRYLSGIATEEEKRQLLNWLKASPDNKSVFFDMKAIWCAKHSLSQSKAIPRQLEDSLTAINRRLDRFTPLKEKPVRRNLSWMRWIAAAVILLVAIVSITFLYDSPRISRPADIVYMNDSPDSVKKLFLPDGTLVWLNTGSSLTYPSEFVEDRRLVKLQGEAFFEVAKDASHPFVVETKTVMVKVLGTSFCITTSQDGESCKTTLQTGSVQLLRADGSKLVVLSPGQQAVCSKGSNKVEVRNVNVDEYISWRFDLITMAEVGISSIIDRLEKTYGVCIKMDTSLIKNRQYNFSFLKNKGVSDALSRLSYMTGVPADTIR